mmetsp:Transcript_88181/g.229891  ORF Transcript_88181/g.229891 Transcript_88181/m.229891 type:complete len:224 (+) Transcript_88181:3-674(+)
MPCALLSASLELLSTPARAAQGDGHAADSQARRGLLLGQHAQLARQVLRHARQRPEAGVLLGPQQLEDDRLRAAQPHSQPPELLHRTAEIQRALAADRVQRHPHAPASLDELQHGLLHADVGLPAPKHDRVAPLLGLHAHPEGGLGHGARASGVELGGQLRHGVAELFGVLLGHQDRDLQLARRSQQRFPTRDCALRAANQRSEPRLLVAEVECGVGGCQAQR